MKKSFLIFFPAFLFNSIFAQEALKSTEEEYYDFLSLQGIVERPTLGYRTLSDSEWKFALNEEGNSLEDSEENIWKDNNLGTKHTLYESKEPKESLFFNGINQSIKFKAFGPEWFNSYNTAAPYGQNDGALWQGKGYNTSFTAGARLEAYGFEMTVKPQVSWSQNLGFDYIQPNYSGTNYEGKAVTYGYYGVASIDAPQRFGDSSFFTFDWADSELRWTWHTFTTGFGTQSIWQGPAKLNPILHSNNAPAYPKFDIGLRKTKINMPHFGWDLGYIETRGWWGYLSESNWFDNDNGNDHNLISGFTLNYAFSGLFDGFSIGFNRIMLSKWNDMSAYTLSRIYIPKMNGASDAADQRFSLDFDYVFHKIGFELYFEWARNDFSPNKDYLIRYPYHTQAWTFGAEKAYKISNEYGLKVLLELTYLENSADYDRLINWYTTFYSHGEITQGHTNRGQWLGAGIGTGGNSQYLGFELYFPKGSITLFSQRRNPDLDYTMYIDSRKYTENYKNEIWSAEGNIRAILDFGLKATYYINKNMPLSAGIVFEDEHNPQNVSTTERNGAKSKHRYNFNISLGLKHNF